MLNVENPARIASFMKILKSYTNNCMKYILQNNANNKLKHCNIPVHPARMVMTQGCQHVYLYCSDPRILNI